MSSSSLFSYQGKPYILIDNVSSDRPEYHYPNTLFFSFYQKRVDPTFLKILRVLVWPTSIDSVTTPQHVDSTFFKNTTVYGFLAWPTSIDSVTTPHYVEVNPMRGTCVLWCSILELNIRQNQTKCIWRTYDLWNIDLPLFGYYKPKQITSILIPYLNGVNTNIHSF